jgi:uncharacterized protein (TIGR00369 family)
MTTTNEPAPFPIELTKTLTGLEQLEAVRDETIGMAPMLALMNMRLVEVSKGRVVFSAVPEQRHYNPQGSVHGGFSATVLDSAMGCAVLTNLGPNTGHTTLEFKINLVRPIFAETGRLRAEAWVVHSGKRVSTAEGRLLDADGKIFAHGSTTCMVLPP